MARGSLHLCLALGALASALGSAAARSPSRTLASAGGANRCSYDVPCRNNGTCEVNTGYCACMLGFGGARPLALAPAARSPAHAGHVTPAHPPPAPPENSPP